MPGHEIAKQELFARLAQGHAAGVTVVTPNQRLARALRLEFDGYQQGRRLAVWEDADILPLEAFVARCHEEALYAEGGEELPQLLSDAQARALWEEAIRGSRWAGALLDVPQTAASAQEAWRLAQAWRIAGALEQAAATEDARAFADWAKAYARRLKQEGFVDSALLADLCRKTTARTLVAYAFDTVPTQARELFHRFEHLYCRPEEKRSLAVRTSFASPREELEAAARWARARLEEGKRRIGVVVPELQLRRRETARVFARVMGSPGAFELSLGEPLAEVPLVALALSVLEFSQREKPFEEVSRILRSPFLAGAEREAAARARLDAQLRRKAEATMSLPKLIGLLEGCPLLRQGFEKVFERSADKQPPQDWARHFAALLEAAGFPGERGLDSAEYQARTRFHEALGEFARLSSLGLEFTSTLALRHLRQICSETLFQPEGAGAPVLVLGLLESAGIGFDALWVSGLTDGQWPQRLRPHPFLPVALQRRAGIPEASAEASLELDTRRTAGWLGAADEVVFSWARREEDRELSPSPLIAQVPEATVELPRIASHRDLIFESAKTETFIDEKAPPLAHTDARGGTGVLADQAACPFRAYARRRLGAEALDAPGPGPDAMARGNLVHALMAGLWAELKSSAGLSADPSHLTDLIERSAAAAVASLGLEGRFAALERERLARLARDWLEVERGRAPFEVVQIEEKKVLEAGGLSFHGRIDRMDRLQDGSYALIDYKTAAQLSPRRWMGERPDEPQLPLYAVSAPEDVAAVAFAKIRSGKMRFMGYSRAAGALPQLTHYPTWDELRASWQASLQALAAGFAAGDARVDPKRGLATCRQCDLQPLCRVHEKLSALGEEEGEP